MSRFKCLLAQLPHLLVERAVAAAFEEHLSPDQTLDTGLNVIVER